MTFESLRGQRFAVLDDVLSAQAWAELGRLFESVRMASTDSTIAPQGDGVAYRTRALSLRSTDSAQGRAAAYGAVLDAIRAEPGLFGAADTDWNAVSFTLWRYPAGSRLSWHNDAGHGRTGAFVFFAHPTWDAAWGGELLLIDEPAKIIAGEDAPASGRCLGAAISDSGATPVAILPRPNRLVLFAQDTLHCVARLEPTVAEHGRMTMTGFVSNEVLQQRDGGRLARLSAVTNGPQITSSVKRAGAAG